MSKTQKLLLVLLLAGMLAVILLTWGSVGSAIMTLALRVTAGYLLLTRFMETHDPDDFSWEE